ncbi:hypothetical protein SB49_12355 [Sediminicola sp. YIK13]|nr:hypothetical protein SB49_12355 [Sediminicola sp. YIK13]
MIRTKKLNFKFFRLVTKFKKIYVVSYYKICNPSEYWLNSGPLVLISWEQIFYAGQIKYICICLKRVD